MASVKPTSSFSPFSNLVAAFLEFCMPRISQTSFIAKWIPIFIYNASHFSVFKFKCYNVACYICHICHIFTSLSFLFHPNTVKSFLPTISPGVWWVLLHHQTWPVHNKTLSEYSFCLSQRYMPADISLVDTMSIRYLIGARSLFIPLLLARTSQFDG